MARKFVKIVKKLSETSGESSWADNHVGEVFLAEWDKSRNRYWVIENGERAEKLLTKSCVEVVTDLTNLAEQGYHQFCVWEGTVLGDTPVAEFEKFFSDQGFRVKFLEEVITLPDVADGRVVEGTGGRHDIFMMIHNDDIMKFAVPRLQMGIRWWEDVLGNGHGNIYPQEVLNKYPRLW
ncbi:MAG: hypothetical protein NC489_26105 [Ruminococcus flavefaciens]|nr:hypothetical protein [Ruminococcus flavefaciens]